MKIQFYFLTRCYRSRINPIVSSWPNWEYTSHNNFASPHLSVFHVAKEGQTEYLKYWTTKIYSNWKSKRKRVSGTSANQMNYMSRAFVSLEAPGWYKRRCYHLRAKTISMQLDLAVQLQCIAFQKEKNRRGKGKKALDIEYKNLEIKGSSAAAYALKIYDNLEIQWSSTTRRPEQDEEADGQMNPWLWYLQRDETSHGSFSLTIRYKEIKVCCCCPGAFHIFLILFNL